MSLSNDAILQERELKQILKQRLDSIVFGDKFSMFNQGITDAQGPEFQEINKEKQFSGAMVGVSNDVLSWIENQMVQDLTPSITEINNQAIEIIEAKKMYKTYIAPVLYSALAWQQMSIKRNDTTRFNETKKTVKQESAIRKVDKGDKTARSSNGYVNSEKISRLACKIKEWIGGDGRVIVNKYGDRIFLSNDGTGICQVSCRILYKNI